MTTTETLPTTSKPTSGDDDKPTLHTYCRTCWPGTKLGNIALCGHRSKGGPRFIGGTPPGQPLCVVCEDLIAAGCPKCGAGR